MKRVEETYSDESFITWIVPRNIWENESERMIQATKERRHRFGIQVENRRDLEAALDVIDK